MEKKQKKHFAHRPQLDCICVKNKIMNKLKN